MSDATPSERPGLPWERRAEVGFFVGMFDTIKGVLLEPRSTFALVRGDGLGGALLYVLILGTLGGIVTLVWQLAFAAVGPLIDESLSAQLEQTLLQTGVLAVLMPAIVVVQQSVLAAVIHLCALVFGAGQNGFDATFRVIAYSTGSTAVLNLIPAFGGMAAFVWGLVAAIIGLSVAHETSGGRAAGAVLTPVLLCCALTVGSVAVAVAMMFVA